MPRAPQYRQQVKQQATTNVRVGVEAPEIRVSNAQAQVGEALGKAAGTAQKFFEQQKKQADDLAALEVDSELSQFTTDYLYNPDTGALNKRGKDAFGVSNDFDEKWREKSEEIQGRLSNNSQRLAFEKIKANRYNDVSRQLQRHVSVEAREYDNQVTESFLSNERNSAAANYLDRDRIGRSIELQKKAIFDHAQRNGSPPEWVQEKTLDVSSRTHSAVLARMLVTPGKEKIARDYYKSLEVGKDITPADAKGMEKMVMEAGIRGDSMDIVDELMNKYASRAQGMKEIATRTKENPELREHTERRFEHMLGQRESAKKEAQERLFDNASALVREKLKATKGFTSVDVQDSIPPDMWTALDPEKRRSLVAIAEDVPNDRQAWLEFVDLSPTQVASLSRTDYETKYWSKFDRHHRDKADERYTMTKNPEAGSLKLAATLSFDDRVRNTLVQAKLIKPGTTRGKLSKKEQELYTKFEQAAAREIERFQIQNLGGAKRAATGEEMQKVMNSLLVDKMKVNDGFFSDSELPAALLTDEQKADAYVPLKDIPEADRQAIENLIKSSGTKVTTDKIQRAYAAWKMKDRARHDAIIKER